MTFLNSAPKTNANWLGIGLDKGCASITKSNASIGLKFPILINQAIQIKGDLSIPALQ